MLIAVADRLIKQLVLASPLSGGEVMTVISNFLQFRYVENTGAAFSIFEGKTDMLSVFSAVVIVAGVIVIFSRKIKSKVLLASVVMMLGGGLGNLIDRVTLHFVVDYIEVLFVDFPVFNFADCFVTVGAFVMIGYMVRDIWCDYKKGKVSNDG
jgi:signal peptidase II